MLKYRVAGLCLGVVGIALLVVGAIIVSVGDKKITQTIQSMESLGPAGSTALTAWYSNVNTTSPTYKDFYLFNVTNPDEVMQGAKPILQQVGPYVYLANTVNFNYSWQEGGNKLQFKPWNYYVFQPDQSVGSEDDIVFNTNIAIQLIWGVTNNDLLSALEIFNYLNQTTNGYSGQLLVNLTVQQWLWGFTDPTLKAIEVLMPSIPSVYPGLGTNQTTQEAADASGFNGMYTGQNDYTKLQTYYMFNGQENLSYWASEEANKIDGTGGVQFHTGVQSGEKLAFFNSAALRTVYLEPASEDEEVMGIKTYKYEEPMSMYYNAETYPANADYYQFGPNGLLNMSVALDGLQIYFSKPHFLDADQSLLDGVVGLEPNAALHRTYVDVEPITGATIDASYKTQVVFKVGPFNFSSTVWFEDVTPVYLPMLWAEQRGMLTEDDATLFKSMIYGTEDKLKDAKWSMIAFGILFCIAGILVYLRSIAPYTSFYKKMGGKQSQSRSISNIRTEQIVDEVVGVRNRTHSFEIAQETFVAADEETRLLTSPKNNVIPPASEKYGAMS